MPANPKLVSLSADLDELRQADANFERGDFIELSKEHTERAVATGASPWPDESSN